MSPALQQPVAFDKDCRGISQAVFVDNNDPATLCIENEDLGTSVAENERSDFGAGIKAGGKALIVLFAFVTNHKSARARLACQELVNLLLTRKGSCAAIAKRYGMTRAAIRKYVCQLETITGKRGLLLGHRAEATRRRCRLARQARTKAAQ